jgi:hypothetical protein
MTLQRKWFTQPDPSLSEIHQQFYPDMTPAHEDDVAEARQGVRNMLRPAKKESIKRGQSQFEQLTLDL